MKMRRREWFAEQRRTCLPVRPAAKELRDDGQAVTLPADVRDLRVSSRLDFQDAAGGSVPEGGWKESCWKCGSSTRLPRATRACWDACVISKVMLQYTRGPECHSASDP